MRPSDKFPPFQIKRTKLTALIRAEFTPKDSDEVAEIEQDVDEALDKLRGQGEAGIIWTVEEETEEVKP